MSGGAGQSQANIIAVSSAVILYPFVIGTLTLNHNWQNGGVSNEAAYLVGKLYVSNQFIFWQMSGSHRSLNRKQFQCVRALV